MTHANRANHRVLVGQQGIHAQHQQYTQGHAHNHRARRPSFACQHITSRI